MRTITKPVLFKDKTHKQKIKHIESLYAEMPANLKEFLTTPISDIWDWYDIWIPWLLKQTRKVKE